MGLKASDIHACLAGWDYIDFLSSGLRSALEHAPASFALSFPACAPDFNAAHVWQARRAPKRLGRQLGLKNRLPIIALRHHDNHAAYSYAVSPFNQSNEPVMVAVIDGYGDNAAISLYVAENKRLKMIQANESQVDSLGSLYGILSSTQGGWPLLSSEGRYMGAAAWGNGDRLTNPYYRPLRQLIYFGKDGQIHVNRAMANWHVWGELRPYKKTLRNILGPPIPKKQMWHPDAVLNIEDIQHAEITQERVDKAAALQLVFEDALFHIIDHLIRRTGSHQLVLCGGTALNCVANMRLLQHFDEKHFERYLGKKTKLHLWVPPTPGDAGVPMGAAYNFALSNGVPPGEKFQHAFYCGSNPQSSDIRQAFQDADEIGFLELGNIYNVEGFRKIADFAAYVVAGDGFIGFFQGSAETGPRALGHRSIVANPCNPRTLENLNKYVKFREPIRPLAPMATYTAACEFFELAPGASDDDFNAYNYMVLTAKVKPQGLKKIPAVVHRDGTSRVQIVRKHTDPFSYAYLKAMGQRVGVEVSVNTSLNVGSPIVQTPSQALQVLIRSKGLSGLILIGADGEAFLAWHNVVKPPKDAGQRLRSFYREWKAQISSPSDTTAATYPSF
jgi:carbamoyltransferase